MQWFMSDDVTLSRRMHLVITVAALCAAVVVVSMVELVAVSVGV